MEGNQQADGRLKAVKRTCATECLSSYTDPCPSASLGQQTVLEGQAQMVVDVSRNTAASQRLGAEGGAGSRAGSRVAVEAALLSRGD